MAYTDRPTIKEYLGISASQTDDDALLTRLITAAQQEIDRFCRRSFETTTATRYYSRLYDRRRGDTLYLDADLLTVTGLTNGNSQVIPVDGSGYWLEPRNEPPYSMIRLKSSYIWTFNTDGEITVVGTWGYATTAPADIVQATVELTAYLYRLKDASTFDVTAIPEMGQLTIPKGWPRHVKVDLEAYRRSEYS